MVFWRWVYVSLKKAILSKTALVFLDSWIPLMVWIWLCEDLTLGLLGIPVWALFWTLYNAYDYYNRWVKEAEGSG